MALSQTGAKNPAWKGGRVIASNGYVLIRVGVDHPATDVRGYAYEHRLVMEQHLGRPLLSAEQVHHKDGNTRNNDLDNLEVMVDIQHHKLAHRRAGSDLRHPDEDNPLVSCACGCAEQFYKYDQLGRPRRYVTGHNPHFGGTREAIRFCLQSGIKSRQVLAALIGINAHALASALSRMKASGEIEQPGRGFYRLKEKCCG